jgi:hypothetical protein
MLQQSFATMDFDYTATGQQQMIQSGHSYPFAELPTIYMMPWSKRTSGQLIEIFQKRISMMLPKA